MSKIQVTADQKARGQKLANKFRQTDWYMNENGQFFTSENLALNSVKGNKDKVIDMKFEIKAEKKAAKKEAAPKEAAPKQKTKKKAKAK